MLVYKRSTDGGATWGALSVLANVSSTPRMLRAPGNASAATVLGNAAPVQLGSGRILVPFCMNNLQLFLTHSDDDGLTWSPVRNITQGLTYPSWQWVGLGPPAGIVLASGRIVLPAYHSYVPHDNGDLSEVHTVLSDDDGATFRLGAHFVTDWLECPNEVQVTELQPGLIFMNARSLWTHRLGAWSTDGGETFSKPAVLPGLTNPLIGCQGSTIAHPATQMLFYSGPSDTSFTRFNMTVWASTDRAASWTPVVRVRDGSSAYSSLVLTPQHDLAILYEWSETVELEFMPTHISFQVLLTNAQIHALAAGAGKRSSHA